MFSLWGGFMIVMHVVRKFDNLRWGGGLRFHLKCMHQILSVDKEPLMQLASLCSLMTFSPSFNTRFNFLHPDRKTILSVSLRGSIMKTHSKTQKVLALNSVLIWKNKYILSFCLFVCLFVCLFELTKVLKKPNSSKKFLLETKRIVSAKQTVQLT